MPSRAAIVAALLFCASSLLVAWLGRGERSGWLLMTSPTGIDHSGNLMIGYSFLFQGEPFMKENIPTVAQVGSFSGAPDALRQSEFREDFRLLRALYGMLASLLEPLFGVLGSMLVLNWLSWAVCAVVAWKLTCDLFGDQRAALLAVVLVAGGIGMTAHIGDYSPHTLAFAGYYLGIWLLYRSGVHCEPRPLRTHLALATFMGIVCLAYNSGVMLLGVYLLVAVRHNRSLHVAAAMILGLASRPLWQRICLALLPNLADVEAEYLQRSLGQWRELFTLDALRIIKTIGLWISEFVLFFDSPLVVLLGLYCCWRTPLPRATRWLIGCTLLVPLAASMVFAPSAGARGYLVFGITIWIYALLSHELVQYARSDRPWRRRWGLAAISLVLVTHFLWSHAHLAISLGPLKTYFLGWNDGVHYLFSPRSIAHSFTGHEPAPVAFGGTASLREAGSLVTDGVRRFTREQVSFGVAFGSRVWYFAWFVLLALLAAPTRRLRLIWSTGLLTLLLASAALSWGTFREIPAFFHVGEAVEIPPHGTLEYRVELGGNVIEQLRRPAAMRERTLAFLINPARGPLVAEFYAGSSRIEARQMGRWFFYQVERADQRKALEMLIRSGEFRMVVRNPTDEPRQFVGWQRPDLRDRSVRILDGDAREQPAPRALPAVELRLLRGSGQIDFVAY